MRTIRNDMLHRKVDSMHADRKVQPFNLSNFFGIEPLNSQLFELISRAISNIRNTFGRKLTENEAFALGVLAYIYSYSSVSVHRILRTLTDADGLATKNPLNPWNRLQILSESTGMSFPLRFHSDQNTACAIAALNLSEEPVLIYTPDIANRYFSYQFIDAH